MRVYHSSREICRQAKERYDSDSYLSIEGVPVNKIFVEKSHWEDFTRLFKEVNQSVQRRSSVLDVRLQNCGIQIPNVAYLRSALAELSNTFVSIDLSRNFVSDASAGNGSRFHDIRSLESLFQLRNVVTLNLSQCNMQNLEYFEYFGQPNSSIYLRRLTLTRNFIDDRGVEFLCYFLSSDNCSLESLVLDDNRITDVGAGSLAKFLQDESQKNQPKKKHLKHVNLAKNNLSCDGVKRLLASLEHNVSLVSLDLRNSTIKSERKGEIVRTLVNSLQKNVESSLTCIGILPGERAILLESSFLLGLRPTVVRAQADLDGSHFDDTLLQLLRKTRRELFQYRKCRAVIVGAAGTGKAHLAQTLSGRKSISKEFASVSTLRKRLGGPSLEVWHLPVELSIQFAAYSYLFKSNCVVLVTFNATDPMHKIRETVLEHTLLIRSFAPYAQIILVGTRRDCLSSDHILKEMGLLKEDNVDAELTTLCTRYEEFLRRKLREDLIFQKLYLVENDTLNRNASSAWTIVDSQVERLGKAILDASLRRESNFWFPSAKEQPNFASFYMQMNVHWFDNSSTDFISHTDFQAYAERFGVDSSICSNVFREMGYMLDIKRGHTPGYLVNICQWTVIWSAILQRWSGAFFAVDNQVFQSVCASITSSCGEDLPKFVTLDNFASFLVAQQRSLFINRLRNHVGGFVCMLHSSPSEHEGQIFALLTNLELCRPINESTEVHRDALVLARQQQLFDQLSAVLRTIDNSYDWASHFIVFQLTLDCIVPTLMLRLMNEHFSCLLHGFAWSNMAIFKDSDLSVCAVHVFNDNHHNVSVISITSTSSNIGMRLRILISLSYFLRYSEHVSVLRYRLANNLDHDINILPPEGVNDGNVFIRDITSLFPDMPFYDMSDSWSRKCIAPSLPHVSTKRRPFVDAMEPAQPSSIDGDRFDSRILQAVQSCQSWPSGSVEARARILLLDTVLRSCMVETRVFINGLSQLPFRSPIWVIVESFTDAQTRKQLMLVHPGARLGDKWEFQLVPGLRDIDAEATCESITASNLRTLLLEIGVVGFGELSRWKVACGVPSEMQESVTAFEKQLHESIVGGIAFGADYARKVREIHERLPTSWMEFLSSRKAMNVTRTSASSNAQHLSRIDANYIYQDSITARKEMKKRVHLFLYEIGEVHGSVQESRQLMGQILAGMRRVEHVQIEAFEHQQQTARAVRSSLDVLRESVREYAEGRHLCPSYFIVAPEPPANLTSVGEYVIAATRVLQDPYVLFKKGFRIYPVCIKTMRAVGNGYPFMVPKDPRSFETVVSVVRTSAVVVTVALVAARVATGLPLPIPQNLPRSFAAEVNYFSTLGQALQCILPDDAWQKDFSRFSKALEVQNLPESSLEGSANARSSPTSGLVVDPYFAKTYLSPLLCDRLTSEAHRQMHAWLESKDPRLNELMKVMRTEVQPGGKLEWVSNDYAPHSGQATSPPVPPSSASSSPLSSSPSTPSASSPSPSPSRLEQNDPPQPNPQRNPMKQSADSLMESFRNNVHYLSNATSTGLRSGAEDPDVWLKMPPMYIVFQNQGLTPVALSEWYKPVVRATVGSDVLNNCPAMLYTVCAACALPVSASETETSGITSASWPLKVPPTGSNDNRIRKRLPHLLPHLYIGYRMMLRKQNLAQFCELAGRAGLEAMYHSREYFEELANLLLQFDDSQEVGDVAEKQAYENSCNLLFQQKQQRRDEKSSRLLWKNSNKIPRLHPLSQFEKEPRLHSGVTTHMKLLQDLVDSRVKGWVCQQCAQSLSSRCCEVTQNKSKAF